MGFAFFNQVSNTIVVLLIFERAYLVRPKNLKCLTAEEKENQFFYFHKK